MKSIILSTNGVLSLSLYHPIQYLNSSPSLRTKHKTLCIGCFLSRRRPRRFNITCTSTRTHLLTFPPPRPNTTKTRDTLLEAESGMEDIQSNTRNDDHNTLKANKQPLMANEIARPTLAKLHNSVHRSPEDADRRQCQSRQEAFELPAPAQRCKDGVLIECSLAHGVEASTSLDGEVDAEGNEDS